MRTAETSAGFVIPLVAVSLALLSLSIWSAADTDAELGARLKRLREEAIFERAAMSAEARVAYLALVEPLSHRAIRIGGERFGDPLAADSPSSSARAMRASGMPVAELALDGRGYRLPVDGFFAEALQVEVQDEAGLLNVNEPAEAPMARALGALGIEERRARLMAAALADLTDADDVRRLNGAEEAEYRRAGLLPPRNAPLREPAGAFAALGWAGALSRGREQQLLALTSARPAGRAFNPNTAPPAVLKAALGLDDRAVDVIVAARKERALASIDDVASLTGARFAGGDLTLSGLPDRRFRLTIRAEAPAGRANLVYRSRMRIAPRGAAHPVYWQPAPVTREAGGGQSRNVDMEELPQGPFLSSP